jgi:hypothetical protein
LRAVVIGPAPLTATFRVNGRFEFHERSQLFIRAHNETFSVVAMRISNPAFAACCAELHGFAAKFQATVEQTVEISPSASGF